MSSEVAEHREILSSRSGSVASIGSARSFHSHDLGNKPRESSDTSLIVRLCLVQGIAQLLYMNVSTLVPTFAEDYHPRFDSLAIGILFASYQIVAIIIAPLLAENVGNFGRRKAVVTGMITMTVSTTIFGLVGLIGNDYVWYSVSLIARVCQGIGDTILLVVIPSIVAIEYPDKNVEYQGYVEASMGLGLMLGPIISTITIRWFGYVGTFLFFAGIIGFVGMPLAFSLPKRLDITGAEGEEGPVKDIPWGAFLKEKRAIMITIASFMVGINLIFLDPILVLRLENLGMEQDNTGLGFACMGTTYLLGAIFISGIASSMDARKIVCFCLLADGVFLLIASGFITQSIT